MLLHSYPVLSLSTFVIRTHKKLTRSLSIYSSRLAALQLDDVYLTSYPDFDEHHITNGPHIVAGSSIHQKKAGSAP